LLLEHLERQNDPALEAFRNWKNEEVRIKFMEEQTCLGELVKQAKLQGELNPQRIETGV
jgi:hypothetical protein